VASLRKGGGFIYPVSILQSFDGALAATLHSSLRLSPQLQDPVPCVSLGREVLCGAAGYSMEAGWVL